MTPSVPELVSYVSPFLSAYTAQCRRAKPLPTPCPTGHRSFSQVRWNSIPVAKPSFAMEVQGDAVIHWLRDSGSLQPLSVSKFPLCVSLPVPVLPLQLLRTPLRRAQMCGALLFDLNIPPWRRNYSCTRVWERRLAVHTDTQSEARFLRKNFKMILNPKLALANKHSQ